VDEGDSWTGPISTPFGTSVITAITWANPVWIAATSDGKIARSTDNGLSWGSLITNPFGTSIIRTLHSGNGLVVAGGDAGKIAYSNDDGATWSSLLPNFLSSAGIYGITYSDPYWVVVADSGRIILSTTGTSFVNLPIATPFGSSRITSVCSLGDVVVAGTNDNKIARSSTHGQTWEALAVLPTTVFNITGIIGYKDYFLATGTNGEILRSTKDGEVWGYFDDFGSVFKAEFYAQYGVVFGSSQFIGVSYDGGESWNGGFSTIIPESLVDLVSGTYQNSPRFLAFSKTWAVWFNPILKEWKKKEFPSESLVASCIYEDNFLIFTESNKLIQSDDGGVSWQLHDLVGLIGMQIDSVVVINEAVLAITTTGVVYTTQDGISWTLLVVPPFNIEKIVYGDGILFAIPDTLGASLYRSTDLGLSWSAINLSSDSDSVIACTYGDGVWMTLTTVNALYRSIDAGRTWELVQTTFFANNAKYLSMSFSPFAKKFFCPGSFDGVGNNLLNSSAWVESGSGIVNSGTVNSNQFVTFSNGLRIEFNDAGAVTYIGYN